MISYCDFCKVYSIYIFFFIPDILYFCFLFLALTFIVFSFLVLAGLIDGMNHVIKPVFGLLSPPFFMLSFHFIDFCFYDYFLVSLGLICCFKVLRTLSLCLSPSVLLLSRIFIPYMFKPHETLLVLFYKVNIHLYVPTLLYFLCSSCFRKSPTFSVRSFSLPLKNTLFADSSLLHWATSGTGIYKSVGDRAPLIQLPWAFLRKRKDFFQRFWFVYVCQYFHLPI